MCPRDATPVLAVCEFRFDARSHDDGFWSLSCRCRRLGEKFHGPDRQEFIHLGVSELEDVMGAYIGSFFQRVELEQSKLFEDGF